MRPRFLLDIDGVCADFFSAALPVIHELSGVFYQPSDFPTWDLFDVIPERFEAPFYERCRAQGFCASIKPYDGAVEGVARLSKAADVRVVTSPIHGPHWYYERTEWVKRHLSIHEKHVTHKSEKEFEWGDYLLDDKPAHIERWAARHPDGLGILWAQPYNEQHRFDPKLRNIVRARSWLEVASFVDAVDF